MHNIFSKFHASFENSEDPDQLASEEAINDIVTAQPGPEVVNLFSCSTQLSTKFQLLINTKIPTNEELSCFKSLKCRIYHANKC